MWNSVCGHVALRIFLVLTLAETNRSFFVTPEKSNDFNSGRTLITHARYWGM